MNKNIEHIFNQASIWQGNTVTHRPSIATGFIALDELLGGWPQGAITEILLPQKGIGELGLLMPALARLSQQGRWIAWVSPPHIPYAPALLAHGIDLSRVLLIHSRASYDNLWTVEQALRSGTCGAVIAWIKTGDIHSQRRLQLAAEAGRSLGILFQAEETAPATSSAALRLKLEAASEGVNVHIFKRRGGWARSPIFIESSDAITNKLDVPLSYHERNCSGLQ